jgi:hypothetical protein
VLTGQIQANLSMGEKEGQGDTRPAKFQCNGCLRPVTHA